MTLKSTPTQYGSFAILIHWLSAFAIIGLLISGSVLADMTNLTTKASMLKIHAIIGITALILTLVRIIWWAFADKKPKSLPNTPPSQAFLAHAVHVLFYIAILVMVGSGIAMMMLSGAGEIIFGGLTKTLPDFNQYPPRAVHGAVAGILIGLIVLHLIGVIYHQWIKGEKLLARMGIGRK